MAKQVKEKFIEESLWQACDKLRGSVESSEYKHVVLGLIFLKFASDKFKERREEIIAEGKENYVEMKDFYNMKNVFFLNELQVESTSRKFRLVRTEGARTVEFKN